MDSEISIWKKVLLPLIIVAVIWAFFYFFPSRTITETELNESLGEISELVRDRDCDLAKKQARVLSRKAPQSAEAFNFIGICDFEEENYSGAKKNFEKVLSLDANNIPAKKYLDIISEIEGDFVDVSVGTEMEQKEFESILGFNLSKNISFNSAFSYARDNGRFFTADYSAKSSEDAVKAVEEGVSILGVNIVSRQDEAEETMTFEWSTADKKFRYAVNIDLISSADFVVSVNIWEE